MPDNPALVSAIRSEIAACNGRIPFARYMDLALYHPEHGYYTTAQPRVGKAGDFFTSVSVGPLFGRILARQFRQWREEFGEVPFQVVEVGGQRGQLRADILTAIPDLDYRLVEVGQKLPARITGCVFSNELLDALPVHRVQVHQGEWREVYIGEAEAETAPSPHPSDGGESEESHTRTGVQSAESPPGRGRGGFSESLGPLSDPRLATALAGLPVHLMEGYRTEINLRALDWLTNIAQRLQRGYLLTIDYGFEQADFFAPHRKDGHLQCYHRHTRNAAPYQHVGEQDITAHVNFTAVIEHGRRIGLDPVRFTDQAHYLLELGEPLIREIVERTAGQFSPERNAIHQLTHPGLMGRSFHVLVQRKVAR